MSLEDRVTAASSRNSELLTTLSSTDHALPALKHQKELITSLESSLEASRSRVSQLTVKRKEEQKDHETYKKSFFRKHLTNKDKFNARAAKEETEYFDALKAETEGKQQLDELTRRTVEAKRVLKEELEPLVQRHQDAQKALDELYDSLFDGPTPSFPEEDHLERGASDALQRYTVKKEELLREDAAWQHLGNALVSMNSALSHMDSALGAASWDVWGGGAMADWMKRDAMNDAEVSLNKATWSVGQAQKYSSQVRQPPEMAIDHGHFFGDVVFDNIFSDMAMRDRLRGAEAQMKLGARHLDEEAERCGTRVKGLKGELEGLGAELERARRELQACRVRAFATVLRGGELPTYGKKEGHQPPGY